MIDLYTIQLATTTVTMIAGVMFVLDTFLRKTDAAGRVWAVSFMSGVLSAFAYAAWVVMPGAWWAVAVGNAAIVLSGALLWSGARAYNDRPHLVWVGAAGSSLAGVAVLAAGPDGGDWAGALVLFGVIAVFAGLGAAESLRAPMRENWTARGLTVMFVVVGIFYTARAVVFLIGGPDDPVFTTFLGTEASAFVLISLIIVTLASLLILQSERLPNGPGRQQPGRAFTAESVLHESTFREVVEDRLERANFHGEQLVFLRVELDELDALNTAFGRSIGASCSPSSAPSCDATAPPAPTSASRHPERSSWSRRTRGSKWPRAMPRRCRLRSGRTASMRRRASGSPRAWGSPAPTGSVTTSTASCWRPPRRCRVRARPVAMPSSSPEACRILSRS